MSVDGVETRLARVEQRVSDLDVRMTAMVPIAGSVIQLTERVETLRRDLRGYAGEVSKLNEEIDNREAATRRERQEARRTMLYLTFTIIAASIGAAAVILTGVH